ncbi:MAG: 30S ribosomal protein S5 [Planctomycetes bacterium]|nr:30S ribosomal protein S5 [Planctomycetota bacterium]
MKPDFNYLDPDEAQGLDLGDRDSQVVVKINRCAAVVKGGRRFSFSALVVLGNRSGVVGIGYGKARDVPGAVEKAVKDAKKHLIRVPRRGNTIPHEVDGRFGASVARLIPAAPGTGIIAGATVRAVMEMAGIRDVLTKAYGSTNPINLVKAAFYGLASIRTREETEKLRGVTL